MLEEYSSFTQVLLATFFTWSFTALGSATVFVLNGHKQSLLDASLGFAAGVMTSATFWSLLIPALDMAEQMNDNNKKLALVPVIVGVLIGAGFVYLTDSLLPENFIDERIKKEKEQQDSSESDVESAVVDNRINFNSTNETTGLRQRYTNTERNTNLNEKYEKNEHKNQFRKIVLLIIAVTVHNIPEGLAVGVGFGAVGSTKSASFQSARNLALGIGIQNFPEGLAVSLPLYASGYSKMKSFFYGQMSGMVEPVAGLLGAFGVSMAQVILPYALAFAAGAMLYVVFENLVPEAASHGNSKLSTWSCLIGFLLMMSLDVGFG